MQRISGSQKKTTSRAFELMLMEEILHQLRLVVYPIIYRVLYIPIPSGWKWDIWTINPELVRSPMVIVNPLRIGLDRTLSKWPFRNGWKKGGFSIYFRYVLGWSSKDQFQPINLPNLKSVRSHSFSMSSALQIWTSKKRSWNHHLLGWYCWWMKSCTTWDVWNPKNNGTFTISTGCLGFQPSTVSTIFIKLLNSTPERYCNLQDPGSCLERLYISVFNCNQRRQPIHPWDSGQIRIIPKPEFFGDFGADSLTFHHHLRWPFPAGLNGRYSLPSNGMML